MRSFAKYYYNDGNKRDKMDGTCSSHGGVQKFIGKP
jgi:hypothetical protein